MANPKPLRPPIRILFGAAVALGPGKVALLEAIASHGSISAAARAMGMSYRRAWTLVDSMNASFRETLVETATGGSGGGGAVLTPTGHEVLRRYRSIENRAAALLEEEVSAFADLLAEPPA